MKTYFKTLSALMICTAIFLSACSSTPRRSQINPARPGDLSYRQLMLKDYEQMQRAVRKYIKNAQQDFDAAESDPQAEVSAFIQLKSALRLILSRPDSENMVAKLIPEVRRELSLYSAYARVMNELAQEGIQAFDSSLGVNTLTLSTYTFMLQNLMGEIQAEARENKDMRDIIQMIADAKITVPYDVMNERKMSGMFLSESPSQQAERILKKIQPSQK